MTQESPPKDSRRILAVIDTNVFISAFISKKTDVATVRVMHALFEGRFTPLYHAKILDEYDEVLHRSKFRIPSDLIRNLFIFIKDNGININRTSPTGEYFPDEKDVIFYEVAMEKREEDAWLVTGNGKHFPTKHFVVTPYDFMEMLDGREHSVNNSKDLITKEGSHDS